MTGPYNLVMTYIELGQTEKAEPLVERFCQFASEVKEKGLVIFSKNEKKNKLPFR
jgi:hypothetical protein